MIARTSSSRISAAVPGRVDSPSDFASARYSASGTPSRRRALGHLERGEAVHVDVGRDRLHEPDRRRGSSRRRSRGGSRPGGRPRWRRTRPPPTTRALELVGPEQVRVAAQVERQRTLREGAEPALERADVRVVDVAVADEGDGVADDVAPELVGDLGDALRRRRPRAPSSVTSSSTPASSPASTPSSTSPTATAPRAGQAAGTVMEQHPRRGRVAARGPRSPVAAEVLGVGRRRHRGADVGVEPLVAVLHVLGVDRQARREHEARGLGGVAQAFERGPRSLGVDVVGRDRRDAAPVVDAGRERARRGRRTGSAGPGGASPAPRTMRAAATVQRNSSGSHAAAPVHRRAGLGQEVLDDDLLHVPVPGVALGDRVQCVEALGRGSRRCRRGCRS